MCCRYAINEAVIGWLRRYHQMTGQKARDIHPSEKAPVLAAGENSPVAKTMTWGFPNWDKQLVINARSETAWKKPLFRDAMKRRRCALPAVWFYEWDHQKRQNKFSAIEGNILFLAGLFNEVGQFVILTTAADGVMRPVHDRMPVCIPEKMLYDWLYDVEAARRQLEAGLVTLRREKPPGQGRLV